VREKEGVGVEMGKKKGERKGDRVKEGRTAKCS